MSRHVATPYGPMPGCPDCGVIVLRGDHVCEHGVTATPPIEVSVTITVDDAEAYRLLTADKRQETA